MLKRQKAVLSLLAQADGALSSTVFVKLVFLVAQETDLKKDGTFYDFVPHRFGPFSFTLYRELESLRQEGYVTAGAERIALCDRTRDIAEGKARELPDSVWADVAGVLRRYEDMSQRTLVHDVHRRYPWYATRSELTDRRRNSPMQPTQVRRAIYTTGYEGRSVDAFFRDLLREGIRTVIDVRANPISRKYGFSGRRLGEFCMKLGLEYRGVPSLGIPGAARVGLNGLASYQRLLDHYERVMLPSHRPEVEEVGRLMTQQPSVLLCVEADARYCHRSRLANAVSNVANLEVVHL